MKWVGNMQFIDGIMERAVYFYILKKKKYFSKSVQRARFPVDSDSRLAVSSYKI